MSPGRREPDGAQVRESRRRELVRAAYNQVAERGFEGLRTREVAGAAGVNIATLHYYFPTKEALIKGVLEYAMEKFRSTLEAHGPPDRQLLDHLRAVRRLTRDEPQLGAVMGELGLRSVRDEGIAEMLRQTNAGWRRTMRGLLRRGVKEGGLRPELDSEEVASLLVTALTAMTLPLLAGSPSTDQALRQLERWLGLTADRG